MHVTPLMVVHEVATRIPFHRGRLAVTPHQDPRARAIQTYANVAAAVLNAHGFTGDVWDGILQHREEIWRKCSSKP